MLSSLEKKQEHKAESFFWEGAGGRCMGLVSLVFFSVLLSDNCSVFAVAIPFKQNHRDVFKFLVTGQVARLEKLSSAREGKS